MQLQLTVLMSPEITMIKIYHFGPLNCKKNKDFVRADLEFYGINHFRPSYHAKIFFNDPDITVSNANSARDSYAGSFSIFGHPTCYGSEGHCEIMNHTRRFDDRPSHPLTRAFKRVSVTEALRKVVEQEVSQLNVSIVVNCEGEPENEKTPLLDFQSIQLVTFN